MRLSRHPTGGRQLGWTCPRQVLSKVKVRVRISWWPLLAHRLGRCARCTAGCSAGMAAANGSMLVLPVGIHLIRTGPNPSVTGGSSSCFSQARPILAALAPTERNQARGATWVMPRTIATRGGSYARLLIRKRTGSGPRRVHRAVQTVRYFSDAQSRTEFSIHAIRRLRPDLKGTGSRCWVLGTAAHRGEDHCCQSSRGRISQRLEGGCRYGAPATAQPGPLDYHMLLLGPQTNQDLAKARQADGFGRPRAL